MDKPSCPGYGDKRGCCKGTPMWGRDYCEGCTRARRRDERLAADCVIPLRNSLDGKP